MIVITDIYYCFNLFFITYYFIIIRLINVIVTFNKFIINFIIIFYLFYLLF